jgi:tRNA dimethylallyltransferase
VVAGPTASGKSDLALELALRFHGEILNCDSVQVYRMFDIGAAKVPVAERKGVPHHLLDVCGPGQELSAGEYARLARAALDEIRGRGAIPIVSGGTGFYLRALIDGLFRAPARDEDLRRRLLKREQARPGSMHRMLERLDPASAARIHVNDLQKTVRAMEVTLLGRAPMSRQFETGRDELRGFRILKFVLNPDRELLYERIEKRTRLMFEAGLVEETRQILEAGYASGRSALASLGYAQAAAHLRGEISLDEAVALTILMTRRYAKRQITWFRRESGAERVAGIGGDPATQEVVATSVCRFLNSV